MLLMLLIRLLLTLARRRHACTQAKPWDHLANDYLALGTSMSLLMIYFCCVILKVKTLTETKEVWAVLSTNLKGLFDVPVTMLSAIMLASVFGSLVFCAMLLFAVMADQQSKERKLRRLRYVRGNAFVELPLIADDAFAHLPGLKESESFHLFLSHAWPLAQDVCKLLKQRCREICPSMRVFLDVEDLVSGGGQKEVDHSHCVIVFGMPVYFEKINCVKELMRAVMRKKPITLLLPDAEVPPSDAIHPEQCRPCNTSVLRAGAPPLLAGARRFHAGDDP